mgnify:CR=1 FL=1
MNIWLSREFAPAEWGEGALLSHRADGMMIHLVTATPLIDIQQAARRLCSQGIQKVALAGHWEREQQWAFAQGLQTPKAEVELQWPPRPKRTGRSWRRAGCAEAGSAR